MEFPPEHYFQTATQRIRQAHHLFQEGSSFALAIYVGGVAVECMLRAFKGRRDATFDEKHDLLRLFLASGMLTIDTENLRAKNWTDQKMDLHLRTLKSAVDKVVRVWANNYRYASEERLRSHLKKSTGYRKIKGDYLKVYAKQFLSSATTIVDQGVIQWHF